MDYVKESVFGVSGVAQIMAKEHPETDQRCKNCSRHAPELQSPLLCLLLACLTSFVAVAPFFRTKDPCVALRTDKFFNKALKILAGVEDKDLSAYLNRKATASDRLFPPVHSQDQNNATRKARDAEEPKEEDACDADDADISRPLLSDDGRMRMSLTEGARNEARFAQLSLPL